MSQLSSYASNLNELAILQGVTSGNPQIFKVNHVSDCVVCVAHEEPTTVLMPIDGLWLCSDSSSPRYLKIYRRVSKTPDAANGTAYTWLEVTDFSTLFDTQSWAAEDLPQPIIITNSGGQLSGKLVPRQVATYDTDEVVPKSVIDKGITTLRNGFFTMYNNMNTRVLYNDERIRKLMTRADEMQAQINGIPSLQVQIGVWVQETEANKWYINHMFGTTAVYVLCWSEDGEVSCYQTARSYDENITEVSFLGPCSGVALVFGLVLPAMQLGI
jgi:hypothetical protein